jgi:hypothetical protein
VLSEKKHGIFEKFDINPKILAYEDIKYPVSGVR